MRAKKERSELTELKIKVGKQLTPCSIYIKIGDEYLELEKGFDYQAKQYVNHQIKTFPEKPEYVYLSLMKTSEFATIKDGKLNLIENEEGHEDLIKWLRNQKEEPTNHSDAALTKMLRNRGFSDEQIARILRLSADR